MMCLNVLGSRVPRTREGEVNFEILNRAVVCLSYMSRGLRVGETILMFMFRCGSNGRQPLSGHLRALGCWRNGVVMDALLAIGNGIRRIIGNCKHLGAPASPSRGEEMSSPFGKFSYLCVVCKAEMSDINGLIEEWFELKNF